MELNHWPVLRSGEACATCAKIDFKALFAGNLAMYSLGTLQEVAQRDKCPTCKLFIQGVEHAWSISSSDIANIQRSVRCWIRSVYWAQHTVPKGSRIFDSPGNDDLDSEEIFWAVFDLPKNSLRRETHHLHHRISLGTDWQPSHQDREYGESLIRYKVADVDIIDNSNSMSFSTGADDLSRLFWRRPLASQCNIDLICGWIAECEQHHIHHASGGVQDIEKLKSIRFRVIDVVDERLVEPPIDCRYITLSYVWGNTMDHYPLDRVVSWQDGILNVESMPQTIRDAIHFTRLLKERYLWVDWLCIDQSNQTDATKLIRHMDIVYESSYCTLVAAAGVDSDAGLPGLRPDSRQAEEITEVTTEQGTVYLSLSRPSISQILQRSRWAKRGWTYQEQLLSKRCIVFTKDEVFYTCPENLHASRIPLASYSFTSFDERRICNWREAYKLETRKVYTMHQFYFGWENAWGRRADDVIGRLIPSWKVNDDLSPRFIAYIRSVEEYTSRKLTSNGDIVAAFSGILHRLWRADEMGTALETGIPLSCLRLGGLLWSSLYPKQLVKRDAMHAQTGNPRFPSWSWSGWEGSIDYPIRLGKDTLDYDEWIYEPYFDKRPKTGYVILYSRALLYFSMTESGAIVGTKPRGHVPSLPATSHASDTIYLWTDCLIISHATETVDSVCETIVNDLAGYIQIDGARLAAPQTPHQREWLLAAVAHGGRRYRNEGAYNEYSSLPEEVIALLIYSEDTHYKRAGIACVPMSSWNDSDLYQKLDWITLK